MDSPSETARILIVDDHPVFCLGMTELINREPDLEVTACPETADQALAIIQKEMPSLLIVDISLAQSNGLDLVSQVGRDFPDLPVLVLSMYDDAIYGERAFRAGARGYVMKQRAITQVVKAVRRVLNGGIHASEHIKEKMLNHMVKGGGKAHGTGPDCLTNRELEVFRLMGEGLESREIAVRLELSRKTIGTHRENIRQKLQLKHYTELVKAAVQWVQENQK
ncbi:MAG: response regulator transcription factor [Desulfobacterales bacterium]|nr:response regulator transcription factor [Desulfobacterales bacterium]